MRLLARGKPYWRLMESGLHLGYRRTKSGGGSWIVRRFLGAGKYEETSVGCADDLQAADGVSILSFGEAQGAARDWWKNARRVDLGLGEKVGALTVSRALAAYFAERERNASKSVSQDRANAAINIEPELGDIELSKLSTQRIKNWHSSLANSGKRPRSSKWTAKKAPRPLDLADPEAVRARRASANRVMTVLKAALNYAFAEEKVASDEAWRRVKAFRGVDAPVIRYLSASESRRLVNACEPEFANLARGALLTGCRYGELARLRGGDFNRDSGTLLVRQSKSGKSRHVVLTDEGRIFFSQLTSGRSSQERVFLRQDGKPWGPSHQQRPLAAAAQIAAIEDPLTFHILRHTYASMLAMRGVPMSVIARQLGHADTRMTERHYAHLAPNYVADTVRSALPSIGIVELPNVTALHAANG